MRLGTVLLVLRAKERELPLPLRPLVQRLRRSVHPNPPKPRPVLLVVVDEHRDLAPGCSRAVSTAGGPFGFSFTAE
jgi:hypothetical protein